MPLVCRPASHNVVPFLCSRTVNWAEPRPQEADSKGGLVADRHPAACDRGFFSSCVAGPRPAPGAPPGC
jgi:hypothetical protein